MTPKKHEKLYEILTSVKKGEKAIVTYRKIIRNYDLTKRLRNNK